MSFEVGQRVRLIPFEGNPEEHGVIIGEEVNGAWMVEVDHPVGEDGLVEVPTAQMRAES